jgi:hypothetical protein
VPSPPWAILQLLAALALPPSAPPFARPNHRHRQKVEPNWAFPSTVAPWPPGTARAWPELLRFPSPLISPFLHPPPPRGARARLTSRHRGLRRPATMSQRRRLAMRAGEFNAELVWPCSRHHRLRLVVGIRMVVTSSPATSPTARSRWSNLPSLLCGCHVGPVDPRAPL